eukprot:TRINITY_DN1110_c3_g1_i1.p1 TRINITY_DN1110_c3_g1~~TRINITY_DN1110_c3_g1_i1.p1  ORF type:complete len:1128 (-),score=267.37 TRINITY_DN1110_c3_g1_i1:47-3430(-)
MKYAFRFSNLCGAVYNKGNVLFTPDGNCLLSPVSNRVSVFNLIDNTSYTLPTQTESDIEHMAMSPNGNLLFTVDERGKAQLINFPQQVILSNFNFKGRVAALRFSPNGAYFAATVGEQVKVWKTPPLRKEFAPFVHLRSWGGHFDDTSCLDWSHDSKWVVAGSSDMSLRIYSMKNGHNYIPVTLTAHRGRILQCFFGPDNHTIYSFSPLEMIAWKFVPHTRGQQTPTKGCSTHKGKWRVSHRHSFNNGRHVSSVSYHKPNGGLFVVGFEGGLYDLYNNTTTATTTTTPTIATSTDNTSTQSPLSLIHSLSISKYRIDTVATSPSGEWLAFGIEKSGQLLVWEWQSETFVLKQQGHTSKAMSCLAYSPDGQTVATGDDFGKVKVWNLATGYCYVTFDKEHKSGITALTFSPSPHGASLFSASIDGTVRAYDLVRYRNFRVFKAPVPVQFTSVAIDWSGEVVCAGSIDPPSIYVWSVQTMKLLDELKGHNGPISCLAFSPNSNILASGSWDNSVRLWDVFTGSSRASETLAHPGDILALAFRPDGRQLAVSSMTGQIHFWDPQSATAEGTLEGRTDLLAGRTAADFRTAKSTPQGKFFTSLCYSGDGQTLIAGGDSKYLVLYDIQQRLVIRRFAVSNNHSLTGLSRFLSGWNMTEAGPRSEILEEYKDRFDRRSRTLPGVDAINQNQQGKRRIRTKSVKFSPTGRSFAAISPEGLVVFSLDDRVLFDPFLLDIEITPKTVRETLSEGQYLKALIMSFRLNEQEIISEVVHSIPPEDIQLIIRDVPDLYLPRLLGFLAKSLAASLHVEFHLLWLLQCFNHHGTYLRNNTNTLAPLLRDLQKAVVFHTEALTSICEENMYSLDYLTSIPNARKVFEQRQKVFEEMKQREEANVGDEDDDNEAYNMDDDEDDGEERLSVTKQQLLSLATTTNGDDHTAMEEGEGAGEPLVKSKGDEEDEDDADDDDDDSGWISLETLTNTGKNSNSNNSQTQTTTVEPEHAKAAVMEEDEEDGDDEKPSEVTTTVAKGRAKGNSNSNSNGSGSGKGRGRGRNRSKGKSAVAQADAGAAPTTTPTTPTTPTPTPPPQATKKQPQTPTKADSNSNSNSKKQTAATPQPTNSTKPTNKKRRRSVK